MSTDSQIIKVSDPSDPRRCQAVGTHGQCMNQSMPDLNNCIYHGGARGTQGLERKRVRNYRVAKLRGELDRHTDSEHLKSLHEEIGITRMTLEAVLNLCERPVDLVIHVNQISSMIAQTEKLVTSCHKLEHAMGGLLDKRAVLQFADRVIGIITDHIDDKTILESISSEIIQTISVEEDDE